MKSFETDIRKYAEKTRLKALEREAIRDRLLTYMEYHPLKKDHADLTSLASLQSRRIYISLNSFWMKAVSGTLAIVMIIGVPLLAERAVPGDVLYLVKTGVNENIQTQLATSPYEKVTLETKLIERRIAEARLLANEGKLTGEVEAQIAETVRGHAEAVQSGLAELREDDAEEAALAEIVFSSKLAVQSAVLDNSTETGSSSVSSILDVVNTVREKVASDASPELPSYEALTARIERETTRTYEYFASIKESATPEEIADIERRMSDIERSITAAKELRATDETGSVAELMNVLGVIQKLITFMTDIDVRETVTLESLVPVTPTPEERIQAVHALRLGAEDALRIVSSKIELIEDEGVAEKVTRGAERAAELLVAVQDALTQNDIERAEGQVKEASNLVADLSKLTEGITAVEEHIIVEEEVSTSTEPAVEQEAEPSATSTDAE